MTPEDMEGAGLDELGENMEVVGLGATTVIVSTHPDGKEKNYVA